MGNYIKKMVVASILLAMPYSYLYYVYGLDILKGGLIKALGFTLVLALFAVLDREILHTMDN